MPTRGREEVDEIEGLHESPVAGTEERDGAVVVRLAGELDLYNAHVVRTELIEVAERGPERLIVELSGVTFIDSTGLGVLIEARTRLANRSAFLLVGPGLETRRALEISGLDRHFALHPLDLAVAAGRFYGGHPPLPYVPGCEAVARTTDGRRVYVFSDGLGVARDGTLGERATVAAERFVPVEEDVDDATAVALGIAGIVGWAAVKRGRIASGDRVLVLGASGTSGRIAVQGAKLSGAERVVAAGRDLRKLERVRELGADEAVALDGDLAAACGGGGRPS